MFVFVSGNELKWLIYGNEQAGRIGFVKRLEVNMARRDDASGSLIPMRCITI